MAHFGPCVAYWFWRGMQPVAMIGITNPPGRSHFRSLMMYCSLICCGARTQSLQAARVCLMLTKFRNQLAFL